jgi:Tfp pilus assembly protein PilO
MRDRVILLSLGIVGLLAAFYFMVLSPKREEASKLGEENTQLQASIDEQKQVATFAEQARQDFPRYYGRLVVLGKAVPDQADQASMLVQLSQVANGSGVEFRAIKVSEGGAASTATSTATAATTPPAGTTTTPEGGTTTTPEGGSTTTPEGGSTTTPSEGTAEGTAPPAAGGSTATPAATTGPVPATEAVAASLPIGATVGLAGLPILPYELTFKGSFFDVADFMSGVDSLVHLQEGSGQIAADGRLLTVDGFSLKPIPTLGGEPVLNATFAVTSYVVPSDEGLTAGAAPGGPSASPLQPQATPTSTTTPTVSP